MSDNVQPPPNSVAIIGMSGRFPGAPDIPTLWRNLIEGRCATTDFCEDELEFSQAALDVERSPAYVRARPILEDVDQFDASFFGILPKQAELMDPQHRVFLEGAWEALESAGYDPEAFPGLVGLYAGVSLNTYLLHNLVGHRDGARVAVSYPVGGARHPFWKRQGLPDDACGPQTEPQGAMCHRPICLFDFFSRCLPRVITVCSHISATWLWRAGFPLLFLKSGTTSISPVGWFLETAGAARLTPVPMGTVFGSGMGIVVLKRLPDAIADGDFIHAVIRGVGHEQRRC